MCPRGEWERDLQSRVGREMASGVLAVVIWSPFSVCIPALNQILEWCATKSTLEFSGIVLMRRTVVRSVEKTFLVSFKELLCQSMYKELKSKC